VFAKGEAMATESDIMESIRTISMRYESVSKVPDWPRRREVYYAHPKLRSSENSPSGSNNEQDVQNCNINRGKTVRSYSSPTEIHPAGVQIRR
jgi:hypothetical protein